MRRQSSMLLWKRRLRILTHCWENHDRHFAELMKRFYLIKCSIIQNRSSRKISWPLCRVCNRKRPLFSIVFTSFCFIVWLCSTFYAKFANPNLVVFLPKKQMIKCRYLELLSLQLSTTWQYVWYPNQCKSGM